MIPSLLILTPPVSAFNKNFPATDAMLKASVCKGLFNYQGLKKSGKLAGVLKEYSISKEALKKMAPNDQIAFYCNLYNVYTLKLIVDNYPIKSIKKISSPWDKKFVPLFGKNVSLNHIEHKILRKEFKEPRIHVAVNCASIGCPNLMPEAFTGANLEKQLEKASKGFLTDPSKNKVSGNVYYASKIFSWYGKDFKKKYGSFKGFAAKYLKVNEGMKVKFQNYDWNLNEIKNCP